MERARMLNWLRAILLVAVAAQGTACTTAAVLIVDEMDNVASKLVQSDCQFIGIVQGMDICRTEGSQAVMPVAYCYRTIGGVDCYDRADSQDRPINRQVTRATTGME